MEPFATVGQYEARYGDVDDQDILQEILMEATREIFAARDRAGIDYQEPNETYSDRLMQACRSMAFRAMGQADAELPYGVTQFSEGAGDFSSSLSFRNPYGEVYISKAERHLLGLGAAKAKFVYPGGSNA